MSGVALRRVGEINLGDLEMIGRLQGQEGLPYPFGYAHPYEHRDERISSIADRLADGDLSAFREWTETYVAAEIWVACRVHHGGVDIPDRRILAYRAGDAGFLAAQRSHDDVIEVFTLAAVDLGAGIVRSIGLTQPGRQAGIVVPGYVGYFADTDTDTDYLDGDDDGVFSVRTAVHQPLRSAHPIVADDDVAALAIIQSRWQPARSWGVDWAKPVVACVRIADDGDYIYTPDFSHAVPLAEPSLSEAIDRLIIEDIAVVRHQRGIE
jgi:hypothetical protein